MKKLNLILVSIHIKNSPQAMPLAAGLLKAQLDSLPEIKDKLDTSFADFYIDETAVNIADNICRQSPDMIGFSTYLWNRKLTEETCRIIKKKLPGIKLFAGGAEATALPQKLLESAPLDFVISGEGEIVLTEVIKKILVNESYEDVAGVSVKNGINKSGKEQWPVMDLNTLPSPFLSGIIDVEKYQGVLWELSRGCPFKCSFCFESRGVAGVRQFSSDRLQQELELFELKKVNQVFVLDPTFNREVVRAKKILRMILKIAPTIHFTFEVRTEFIDNEMAELFSKMNCSLQIGLQSAIPEVLKNVNRKFDPDTYAEKISLLNNNGVIFGLDLIYGLPGDNLEGFKHSLNYALRLQPNHLDIFPLAVLPGTALYDEAESFNLNYLREVPYTLISSPGFSEDDLAAAESLKKACNIFYNIGGAAGWMFMVYETLGIDPCEFIERFCDYILSENIVTEPSGDKAAYLQKSFIKMQFAVCGKKDLYPAMEDIVNFHTALNNSLYAGPVYGDTTRPLNTDTQLKAAPGTFFIELKYNFDELMTVGEFTLEEFTANFSAEKTSVIIYNYHGEIKPLIVDDTIYKVLQFFRKEHSLNDILLNNTSLNNEEINEFIEYAVSETIVYMV